ncbi:hypothetical protein B0A55_12284, partial [Friedmanniomyces simplex]
IRATFSECGRYVTCGSEDKRGYIWSLRSSSSSAVDAGNEKRDRHPMEFFEAHDSITTIVRVAPSKTRGLLGKSNDPVYDLCNPPPVTLMSRAERTESQGSSRPPSVMQQASNTPKSSHSEGNIIVTADFEGKIKVFRQDCAWSKRKVDDFDRSSIFGKRASVRSAGSLATKGSQRSLRETCTSTSTQGAGDRIMTWRQGVASTSTLANGSTKQTSRSVSPSKSLADRMKMPLERAGSLRSPVADGGEEESVSSAALKQVGTKTSASEPTAAGARNRSSSDLQKRICENPLHLQNGQSYVYYDVEHIRERAERVRKLHEANGGHAPSYPALTPVRSISESEGGLAQVAAAEAGDEANGRLAVRPPVSNGQMSYVSRLSDERSSEEEDEFDDANDGRRRG